MNVTCTWLAIFSSDFYAYYTKRLMLEMIFQNIHLKLKDAKTFSLSRDCLFDFWSWLVGSFRFNRSLIFSSNLSTSISKLLITKQIKITKQTAFMFKCVRYYAKTGLWYIRKSTCSVKNGIKSTETISPRLVFFKNASSLCLYRFPHDSNNLWDETCFCV